MSNIDCEEISSIHRARIRNEIEDSGKRPLLAIVSVGNTKAGQIEDIELACNDVGIDVASYFLDDSAGQKELNEVLDFVSNLSSIDGILLPLPLPNNLNERDAIQHINKDKDVNCLTEENIFQFYKGQKAFLSCVAKGVIEILDSLGYQCRGKNVVILGKNRHVEGIIGQVLRNRGATVIMCWSDTNSNYSYTRQADLVISAMGKPRHLTSDKIKPDSLIIDIGSSEVNHKMVGDVSDDCGEKAICIPYKRGIDIMTMTALLENIMLSVKK